MKLIKFRICNYKSIIDSGYCLLASDLTILIGKNESGKTAILEALRDFDKEVFQLPQNAFPVDGNDESPLLELCFQLNQTEIDNMFSRLGILHMEEFSKHILINGISILKESNGQYSLKDDALIQLITEKNDNRKKDQKNNIKSAKERLNGLLEGRNLPDLNIDSSPEEIQKKTRELTAIIKTFLPSLNNEKQQNDIVESLRTIIQVSNKLTEQDVDLKQRILEYVLDLLPRFLYFSEFVGQFPFEIPLEKLKETDAMLDFAKISGLDLERVANTPDIQKRINLLNRHSAVINGEFGDYWQQNQIELIIKPEGGHILFGIKEQDKTDIFKVEQRSKGFQWFLSFYLRLSAQDSQNNVILIDEPGMNLHAKAQQEILKVLVEKIAPKTPVIFSTHSPYFINPSRLDRIRIVRKNSQVGSVVCNQIQEDIDADTLIPIKTALGSETNKLLPLAGKCNIVIQNLADYYFLNALKPLVKIPGQKEVNLLPCPEGARNTEQLVSFLSSFAFDFRVVFNSSSENQIKGMQLKEIFKLSDERVVFIPRAPGLSTADLFSQADFYTYIAKGLTQNKDVSNAQYLKNNNIDPILAARNFHEQAKLNPPALEEKTVSAFQKVFDQILSGEKPGSAGELPTPQGDKGEVTKEPPSAKTVAQEEALKSGKEAAKNPPPDTKTLPPQTTSPLKRLQRFLVGK